ncbi:MAG TPA: hypothetical protein PLE77_03890 [Kiritimatiellia bacterium]|nr:hypothetical protein [Kiritimatiellia bacterium]
MQIRLVHNLFYTWAGWPSDSVFPAEPDPAFFAALGEAWAQDHLRLHAIRWRAEQIQMTFRVEPDVSPTFFTSRVKGRLQHALRQARIPVAFSRKIGMRALGENLSATVEAYLAEQSIRAELADDRYRATLQQTSFQDDSVDLSMPTETKSGRYWYNLHLVAVTQDRFRMGREDFLPRVRIGVKTWASETGSVLKALACMPDHLHISARGSLDVPPQSLAESLWITLNRAAGCQLFCDRIYAGTFSEYSVLGLLK